MKPILVPTAGVQNWQQLLADPVKHWQTGYSAKALAYAWEEANGLPTEVAQLFQPFGEVELLIAIPEYKVPLPGGEGASQNDVFTLLRTPKGLVAAMIEGKVAESFGPTVEKWRKDSSPGKTERLRHLCSKLGLADRFPPGTRYQILHRAASAVIEAERFHAADAALIVHSFSPTDASFSDYSDFLALFAKTGVPGQLVALGTPCGIRLWAGWAKGDRKFLSV